jgi:hypothetical protein
LKRTLSVQSQKKTDFTRQKLSKGRQAKCACANASAMAVITGKQTWHEALLFKAKV